MTPSPMTSAKSRTRLRKRLAIRGVPRERPGQLQRAAFLTGDVENPRAAGHDLAELLGVVKLQMHLHPEAVAQRRRKLARAGGRPDQGKMRQVQADRAGRRSLADHDVELKILHGGIKDLLNRAVESVNLIDEKDVMLPQIRQQRDKIPLPLESGAGGHPDLHPHFIGDDLGQRRFAEARRA